MLVPSKKIFYAIEAVLYIAYNAKAGPIGGSEVAQAQHLPTRYLEPIMQKLVRAGILKGVRGPQGGYVLGRERRRISLADICATITDEGSLPKSATALGEKILRPSATTLMQQWKEGLANISIANLCEQATAAKLPSTNDASTDFTI
jgi:Rrf2 family iron-sulfur cluster assembly transcriptional regulator